MSAKFEFTITVKGAEGEKYATNKGVVFESGIPQTVILGHDESIVIYGLSENDTYTVVENDPGEYTATGEVKEALAMGKDDKTVTVINTLDTTIPTGVIETVAPFALMIVAALGFAVVYFRKRNIEA